MESIKDLFAAARVFVAFILACTRVRIVVEAARHSAMEGKKEEGTVIG